MKTLSYWFHLQERKKTNSVRGETLPTDFKSQSPKKNRHTPVSVQEEKYWHAVSVQGKKVYCTVSVQEEKLDRYCFSSGRKTGYFSS